MAFRELTGNYKITNTTSYAGVPASLVIDTDTFTTYVLTGTGPMPVSSVLQSSTPLSVDQLLNSQATPVELLPPPGENLIYLLQSVNYFFKFNTTGYYNDGGGIWYGGSSISADTGDNGVFGGIATQIQQSLSWSAYDNTAIPVSLCVNQGLYFWSPDSALTGGDGTAIITLYYSIISVA